MRLSEWNNRPIANNGVSLEDIVDILEDVRTKSEKHWHGAYTALSIDQGKAIIAKLQPTAPRGGGEIKHADNCPSVKGAPVCTCEHLRRYS